MMFESERARFHALCANTPPIDMREVMVGQHKANWRKKLSDSHKKDEKKTH